MIYATFSNVIFIRSYKDFCSLMDIPHGPGASSRRTPAESRTVHQFLLAVNAGRSGVFINLNLDIAVIVERDHIWVDHNGHIIKHKLVGVAIGKHLESGLGSRSHPISEKAFNKLFRG